MSIWDTFEDDEDLSRFPVPDAGLDVDRDTEVGLCPEDICDSDGPLPEDLAAILHLAPGVEGSNAGCDPEPQSVGSRRRRGRPPGITTQKSLAARAVQDEAAQETSRVPPVVSL